jgi:putative thioredoxin
LGPLLEKVIDDQDGKVVGVKIDVDANPAISEAFQVQSIPMVIAFKDGKPVDGFMGAQGEPTLRDFVAKLLPSEEETELESLVALGDEVSLRAALDIESDHEPAVTALAEILVNDGRAEEGLALLRKVPESAQTRRISALARTIESPVDADEVEIELADLLSKVKDDDDARQRFVDLLEVMGADDPRTPGWRKKLSMALF